MIKKTLLIASVLTLNIFNVSHLSAQESQTFIPPGSNYVNKAAETIKILNARSLKEEGGVVPNEIHLSVVQYDYMEPGQFGILMKTPETVTGCYDISPISYEASYVADLYMDVAVKSYTVTPIKTKNVDYGCNQSYRAATGLLVLNIDDLRQRGTRQIRFTNGNARDNYNIMINEGAITLQPESMIAFKTKDENLKYTMGGGSVIALQVPMANDNDLVAQEIRTLAASNSLTPITDMTAFDLKERDNVFYYLDDNGRFSDQINNDGYAEIGSINVARPHLDETGMKNIAVPLKVFVTKHNHTL